MHGRIAFHLKQLRHLHAARLRHTADVIAQKIHDHQVLGAVLLVLRQPRLATCILCRVFTAGLRAFHRARLNPARRIGAEKQLRRT